MVFTDDLVRALLAVGRQVALCEVVAGQALVAGDVRKSCEGGAEAYPCGSRWELNLSLIHI